MPVASHRHRYYTRRATRLPVRYACAHSLTSPPSPPRLVPAFHFRSHHSFFGFFTKLQAGSSSLLPSDKMGCGSSVPAEAAPSAPKPAASKPAASAPGAAPSKAASAKKSAAPQGESLRMCRTLARHSIARFFACASFPKRCSLFVYSHIWRKKRCVDVMEETAGLGELDRPRWRGSIDRHGGGRWRVVLPGGRAGGGARRRREPVSSGRRPHVCVILFYFRVILFYFREAYEKKMRETQRGRVTEGVGGRGGAHKGPTRFIYVVSERFTG
jgi:hypothetical protein